MSRGIDGASAPAQAGGCALCHGAEHWGIPIMKDPDHPAGLAQCNTSNHGVISKDASSSHTKASAENYSFASENTQYGENNTSAVCGWIRGKATDIAQLL